MAEALDDALVEANGYLEICVGLCFLCYDQDIPLPQFSFSYDDEDKVTKDSINITFNPEWSTVNPSFRIRYLFGKYLSHLGDTPKGETYVAELIAALLECCEVIKMTEDQ